MFIKKRLRKWRRRLAFVVIIITSICYYRGVFHSLFSSPPQDVTLTDSKHLLKQVFSLERKVKLLESVLKRYAVPDKEYADLLLPTIYVVTPTYARPHQKAELTRLKSVFLHVPALHWIVVEDASQKSQLVSDFLKLSGLPYTHLNKLTPVELKLQKNDPNWRKPRGVLQRNAGIRYLRSRFALHEDARGVVYFADDDNTYSIELFQEMRDTKTVSVWPVGLVGGVMVERPQVQTIESFPPRVTGWLTGWKPNRPFATDMAGFAVNLSLLLKKKGVEFSNNSQRGYIESDFLTKLVTMDQLEPKADSCTKVYIWHTRTEKPNMKDEERLRAQGKSTNQGIEV